MHWRDIDDDTWEGLAVTLTRDDLPAHPRWTTDIVRPGRVRITAGHAARWWARQARDLAGVSLLRGAPMTHDDAVVRPITRDDLSAVTASPGTIAWWRSNPAGRAPWTVKGRRLAAALAAGELGGVALFALLGSLGLGAVAAPPGALVDRAPRLP